MWEKNAEIHLPLISLSHRTKGLAFCQIFNSFLYPITASWRIFFSPPSTSLCPCLPKWTPLNVYDYSTAGNFVFKLIAWDLWSRRKPTHIRMLPPPRFSGSKHHLVLCCVVLSFQQTCHVLASQRLQFYVYLFYTSILLLCSARFRWAALYFFDQRNSPLLDLMAFLFKVLVFWLMRL